jgi:mRNA-degrading endonuclease RelE of RelBE toxin-antitoxin system
MRLRPDKDRWKVLIDGRAEKELSALPENIRAGFYRAFELLEEDPFKPRPGCDIRFLSGGGGARAIRVGQYRGIYQVLMEQHEVRFTTFAHRRSVYK